MKNIFDVLKKLEQDKGIRIIFAVESGSREWEISSKDSDYDVRGVYCYPPEKYYDIQQYAENFTEMQDDIDIHLAELRKFIRLLLNSNPTCIEWIQSKTTYIGKIPEVFKNFLKKDINHTALAYHYQGLAKQNYMKYLRTRNEPTVKRYLYACRGILAGMIAIKGKIPPIQVPVLIDEAPITKIQKKRMKALVEAKLKGTEQMLAPKLPEFDKWLEDFINTPIPQFPRKIVNTKPYREYVLNEIRKRQKF